MNTFSSVSPGFPSVCSELCANLRLSPSLLDLSVYGAHISRSVTCHMIPMSYLCGSHILSLCLVQMSLNQMKQCPSLANLARRLKLGCKILSLITSRKVEFVIKVNDQEMIKRKLTQLSSPRLMTWLCLRTVKRSPDFGVIFTDP